MLDLLLSMSSTAILIFNENGKVIQANHNAAQMFGYSLAELKRRRINSLLPKRVAKNHAKLFKEFLAGGETLRRMGAYRQIAAIRRGGEEFPVDASIGKGQLDGRTVLVASLRDVTAEQRAEDFVRSLALFPQENPNPVFRIKDSGEILFANANGNKLLKEMSIRENDKAPEAWVVDSRKALESNSQIISMFWYNDKTYSCAFAPVREKGYVNLYALDITERETEKVRLALSDEILNTIGNLVLVANSKAEVIYVSPSVRGILGYEPAEILGDGWWRIDRVSGGDVDQEKEYLRKAAQGEIQTDGKPYEHRVRHKDGSWRWLMLADAKGPRDLLIGIGTDITNIKRAEEELQTQRDFAETLTNQMGQGLTVTDELGRFTFVNPSFAKALGYQPDELLGKTPFDITFTDDHISLLDAQSDRMKGGISTYESRLRGRDGRDIFALITGVPRKVNGRYAGAITVVTDLTERRRMENSLRENEEFIRALYEITSSKEEFSNKVQALLHLGMRRFHLPIGILSRITGEQYQVVAAESPYGSINGGDTLELGKTYCEATIRASEPLSFHQAKGTLWASHPCYSEFGLEAYLGVPVYVSEKLYGTLNFSSREPLPGGVNEADKNFIQLMSLWIGEEIGRLQAKQQILAYTEEIQKNNIQLAEARDRALDASYLKSAFLATMSHEIRTPMNAIMGMTEMLLDTELNKEQREYAEIIDSSTHNLLGILNDILDFSKIEAGKLSIKAAPFKPEELVREIARLFQPKAHEKEISISLMVTQTIPEILVGDAGRIRQILSNLVSNAIKFTEKHGSVFINISGTHFGDDRIMTTFTVQDSGIGIPEAIRQKLFEPFTQGDVSNTRKHGGTGLGLAISKRLTDLMHGEIGFESIEGSGSTFWFSLPLSKNIAGMMMEEPVESASHLKYGDYSDRKPILIVEDNLVNRDLFILQLREFGLSARHAGNGMEAVELLQVEPEAFSLVMMDLNMPVMDGFTATHLIRELEVGTGRHIPIVAVTANAMQGSRELCLNAGMDDFVSKPISLASIRDLLQRWMDQ